MPIVRHRAEQLQPLQLVHLELLLYLIQLRERAFHVLLGVLALRDVLGAAAVALLDARELREHEFDEAQRQDSHVARGQRVDAPFAPALLLVTHRELVDADRLDANVLSDGVPQRSQQRQLCNRALQALRKLSATALVRSVWVKGRCGIAALTAPS